ncbi:MAG: FAD-binding oxidoreductase [Deltaproteobacteria bacterium]|nr:FAD-binding oxidoreductase [Deltaproteobacteria bacterium]
MTIGTELARAVGDANVAPIAGEPAAWQVAPAAPAEIAEVVRLAQRHKIAVVPLGTGIRPSADRGPRVQIAMRRMDHVIHLDETSLLVHVQAGLTGMGLEKILVPRGLSIGDYPPAVLVSTLGGILAVRTPGKSSVRHGFFEDAVVGVSAVLGDGRTVHTRVAPRRSTGPDLARALCGSEGTIGVITGAVLRIHRKPEARFAIASILPSIDAAVSAVYLALREEAALAGVRIYDAAEARIHFANATPPLPAMSEGEALVVASTAGPTDLAACDRDLVASAVAAEGGRTADTRLAELWWRRIHAGEPTPVAGPTLQVTATPGKVRAVYRAVCTATAGSGGARAHVSRFDADGAVVFFTLAGGEAARATAETAAREAGGYLLGARATALDPYLIGLRAALDPHGIMNPNALRD